MTKFQLEPEYEIDFLLIGISSHARDYRLCWSLNSQMGLNLVKAEKEIEINNARKKITARFALFEYEDEGMRINYSLIANKGNEGYLLPEIKHADFVLMLKNNIFINIDEIIDKIKKCDAVLTAFEINAEELKSREYLIF